MMTEQRDYRDYNASCAICGRPSDGECVSGCETERLNLAIEQAEAQWIKQWREKTREWVAHNAVKYVSQMFAAMKESRIATYAAELKAIPYIQIYDQYKGRPPLHPQYVAVIQRQIHHSEYELRRNIDSDWRSCVLRYPEVLAHYYSLVNVTLPKEAGATTSTIPSFPSFPSFLSPAALTAKAPRSTTSSATAQQKKARRVSLSTAATPTGTAAAAAALLDKGKAKEDSLEALAKLLQGQNLPMGFGGAGGKPMGASKAGRASPAFDLSSKAGGGGKKRNPNAFDMFFGKQMPRAPTAPPMNQSPWGLPTGEVPDLVGKRGTWGGL